MKKPSGRIELWSVNCNNKKTGGLFDKRKRYRKFAAHNMEMSISCDICNDIFNHTSLYQYHQGKLLLHLTLPSFGTDSEDDEIEQSNVDFDVRVDNTCNEYLKQGTSDKEIAVCQYSSYYRSCRIKDLLTLTHHTTRQIILAAFLNTYPNAHSHILIPEISKSKLTFSLAHGT